MTTNLPHQMKADLRYRPSFFSPESRKHLTERWKPALPDLIQTAAEREIGIVALTSCKNRMFDYYAEQAMRPGGPMHIVGDREGLKYGAYWLADEEKGFFSNLGVEGGVISAHYCLTDKLPLIFGDVHFINGIEVKAKGADVNLIGVSEIPKRLVDYTPEQISIEEALEWGRKLGTINSIRFNNIDEENFDEEKELVLLYKEKGLLDCVDAFVALDLSGNRNDAHIGLAKQTGLAGLSVSDGHRLADIGVAGIHFYKIDGEIKGRELVLRLREIITSNSFRNEEKSINPWGKVRYWASVIEATALGMFGKQ